MTHGSLRCEIPTLEPDDDFVDRLAELAAASRPARGGIVVPVAFGGPSARAVAIAAAVAAVTAGAAAAATQLSHARQDEPSPPTSSVGIHRPDAATGRHSATHADHVKQQESDDAAEPADDRTGSDPGTARQSPAANVPAAPAPHGPGDTTSSNDDPSAGPGDHHGEHHGDDHGDDGDHGDHGDHGNDQGEHSGDGDNSGDDGGDSGPGSSDGGSQDGGGKQAGSDGSGAGPGRDPSSVLNGSSD